MAANDGVNRREFLRTAALTAAFGKTGFGLDRSESLFTRIASARSPGRRMAAARPFNMLVLGDSYAWQPGLLRREKTFTLVQQHITEMLDGFRTLAPPRVFARSGAVIGDIAEDSYKLKFAARDAAAPWPDKVPDAFWDDPQPGGDREYAAPSAWGQMARALDPNHPGWVQPDLVDFIILSGGGNDVGITHAVSPWEGNSHHQNVRQRIRDYCGGRMKLFLPRLASAFPTARIVVTGYPQMISDRTNSMELGKYLIGLGIVGGSAAGASVALLGQAGFKEASRQQSEVFAEETSNGLREAVDAANATMAGGRCVFADVRPLWHDVNAYGAPDSYFWHYNAPDHPPDHTADERNVFCLQHPDKAVHPVDFMLCVHGAMGHPNPNGAVAYSTAIAAALDGFGVGWLGLKAMAVCADVTVLTSPDAKALSTRQRGEVVEAETSDQTFSFTIHARDSTTNAPLAASVDVGGKASGRAETTFPVKLCDTKRDKTANSTTFLAREVAVPCAHTVSVGSPGYARVTFATTDIFGGRIPGTAKAPAAAVGTTFQHCVPPVKVGTIMQV